jgi:hypothetical protein
MQGSACSRRWHTAACALAHIKKGRAFHGDVRRGYVSTASSERDECIASMRAFTQRSTAILLFYDWNEDRSNRRVRYPNACNPHEVGDIGMTSLFAGADLDERAMRP